MGSRGFSVDLSLDIISMLAKSGLKALCTSADIFILWMVLAVDLGTVPIIDDVLVLAVDSTGDMVDVSTDFANYLTGRERSVGADRALFSTITATSLPSRS